MCASATTRRLLCLAGAALFSTGTGNLLGANDDLWSFDGDLSARTLTVAEGLAARAAPGLVADPAAVAAFSADLQSIYDLDSGLAAATPFVGTESILVRLDPVSDREAVIAAFPAEVAFESYAYLHQNLVVLTFGAVVNQDHLAAWAEAHIPAVLSAEANRLMGDGDDVRYYPEADLYAFKRGQGDCPSGCLEEFWRFVLMSAAGPVEIGVDELDALFPGELNRTARTSIQAARGDVLSLADLAAGPYQVFHQGAEVSASTVLLEGKENFGRYELVIARPFGLDPVVHEIVVLETERKAFLLGERLVDGWVRSATLGWVYDQSHPWVWQEQHGWIYLHPHSGDASWGWAFQRDLGWFALAERTYPWIYASGTGWLYYLEGSSAPRTFFCQSTGSWLQFE